MRPKIEQKSRVETRAFHRLANLFSLIEGVEFESLVADVKANGLREPITLFDGAILDGRNRFHAREAANVEPRFEDYTGDDPLGFVLSKNVHRRQLTKNQRALAAARVVETAHGGDRKSDQVANWQLDRDKAAALFRVKLRTLDRAAVVIGKGAAELVAAVESGDVAVSKAAKIAERPHDDQRAWLLDPQVKPKTAKPPAADHQTDHAAFLAFTRQLIEAAKYTGPVDPDVWQAASDVSEAWDALYSKLNQLSWEADFPDARPLSPQQRAMAAARLANLADDANQHRKKRRGKAKRPRLRVVK